MTVGRPLLGTAILARLGICTGCVLPIVGEVVAFGQSTTLAGLRGGTSSIYPTVPQGLAFSQFATLAGLWKQAGCILPIMVKRIAFCSLANRACFCGYTISLSPGVASRIRFNIVVMTAAGTGRSFDARFSAGSCLGSNRLSMAVILHGQCSLLGVSALSTGALFYALGSTGGIGLNAPVSIHVVAAACGETKRHKDHCDEQFYKFFHSSQPFTHYSIITTEFQFLT